MKQPFRHFRGELNGHYLKALAVCSNYAVRDVIDELVYQTLFQWKLEETADQSSIPIRESDIVNIARIAGVVQSYAYTRSSLGSIQFSQSHIVDGKERSERGLVDMTTGLFKYTRERYDTYPDDIVTEASKDFRIGLVPEGAVPVGYLPYGRQLFTPEGDAILENLLPNPPNDGTPYTPYYGEKFLTLEEYFNREVLFSVTVFKLLFECMQRIRRNGPSITELMLITRLFGEGYIYDIEIVPCGRFYTVFYSIDASNNVSDKDRRLTAWRDVCSKKFKLFVLQERSR